MWWASDVFSGSFHVRDATLMAPWWSILLLHSCFLGSRKVPGRMRGAKQQHEADMGQVQDGSGHLKSQHGTPCGKRFPTCFVAVHQREIILISEIVCLRRSSFSCRFTYWSCHPVTYGPFRCSILQGMWGLWSNHFQMREAPAVGIRNAHFSVEWSVKYASILLEYFITRSYVQNLSESSQIMHTCCIMLYG